MAEKGYTRKEGALRDLGLRPNNLTHDCGCCEYALNRNEPHEADDRCIEHCPISEGKPFGCEQGDHPYHAWTMVGAGVRAANPNLESHKVCGEYAGMFVEYMERKLKELP
jgi:hypothetical protein